MMNNDNYFLYSILFFQFILIFFKYSFWGRDTHFSTKRNLFNGTEVFFFFFFHSSCHEFIGSGFQHLRLLSIGPHRVYASLGGAGWCFSWMQASFSLASFFFRSFSFTHLRKLSKLLECSIHTLFSWQKLCPYLVCLQQCQEHAGYTIHSSSFATLTCVAIPFWIVPIPLMPTISPFWWICMYAAKGTAPSFLKVLESICLLSLSVGHFSPLLKDGGSSWKAPLIMF